MADDLKQLDCLVTGDARVKRHLARPLQTPGDVLDFWFGSQPMMNASMMRNRMELWWKKSDDTDRLIARKGVDLLARLAAGEAESWANRGSAERLAAIISLDQFSRNIFRNSAAAFENDALALKLCKDGLGNNEHIGLTPLKRWFFYMPLEHSENLQDQKLCVELLKDLVSDADDVSKTSIEGALDYARKHREVIEKFGRFPHRNEALDRISTKAEKDYLAKPGSGF